MRQTENQRMFAQQGKAALSKLYWKGGLSLTGIAKHYGVGQMTVVRRFAKLKIKLRDSFEQQTARNARASQALSPEQEQLIWGSLLGDACLHRDRLVSKHTGRQLFYYGLDFYHTERMAPYMMTKHALLGRSFKTGKLVKIGQRVSGLGSLMRGFTFKHTPTLAPIAKIVLDANHKKRVTRAWMDHVQWRGVAFWYQDDGTLAVQKDGRASSLSLCTDSFSKEELAIIQQWLLDFGDFHTTLRQRRQNQWRITLNRQEEIQRFLQGVRPHIVPCMAHKIRTCRA